MIPLVVTVVVVKTVSLDFTKPPDIVGVTPASMFDWVLLLVGCCMCAVVSVPLEAVGVATKEEFSSLVMLM